MTPAARRFHIIINARSGAPGKDAAAERVSQHLAERGVPAHLDLIRRPEDLADAAARAAASDADVVVAGGGDGTISGVSSAVAGSGKMLGVLPLGTFNYFARRIGVPLDLDAALDVLTTSTTVKTMSVGEVNGRIFLNNASIGLYPAVLKHRETAYRKVGRSQAVAYLSVALVLVRPRQFLKLQVSADGEPLVRRTPLLFVGTNAHQMETFGLGGQDCLEEGKLAAYITRPMTTSDLWRLALRGFFRGLHGAPELELVCAQDLYVTLPHKRVRVAMDGELVRLHSPLRFRMRPHALHVLTAAAETAK
jgi:YegS/Rv2252/BmrU family lipid kinase